MENQLQQSNEILKQQKTTSKLESMETQIFNANLSKKIAEFDSLDDGNLVKVLTLWRTYLGVKEEMTAFELDLNISHIKEMYPEYTLDMIKMAIKCSMKGELKCDTKPYGSFSPFYISTILNAYKS